MSDWTLIQPVITANMQLQTKQMNVILTVTLERKHLHLLPMSHRSRNSKTVVRASWHTSIYYSPITDLMASLPAV